MEVLSRQKIYQVNGGTDQTRLVLGGVIGGYSACMGLQTGVRNSDHTHPVGFVSPVITGTAVGITTMLLAGNRPTANALAISATTGALIGLLRKQFGQ